MYVCGEGTQDKYTYAFIRSSVLMEAHAATAAALVFSPILPNEHHQIFMRHSLFKSFCYRLISTIHKIYTFEMFVSALPFTPCTMLYGIVACVSIVTIFSFFAGLALMATFSSSFPCVVSFFVLHLLLSNSFPFFWLAYFALFLISPEF